MSFDMTDITESTLDGNGAFDALVKAFTLHLDKQYSIGRITGTEYANVYIQALQAALQQAVVYTLQKPQVDAQTALIQAQRDQAIAETANTQLQYQLLQKQIEQTTVTINNLVLEGNLLAVRTDNTAKEGLQIESNTALTDQNVANAVLQAAVLVQQEQRGIAEVELINQKTKTEVASIRDTVDGVTVDGLVGKQKALYAAQTNGYARDAEQKASKIMSDMYQTLISNDPALATTLPTEFSSASLGQVINKLKSGIGI